MTTLIREKERKRLRNEAIVHRLVTHASAFFALFTLLLTVFFAASANAARIKDIVEVEGVRDNILMGYGLVVGLSGTGDRLQNNAFTEQSLLAFLERQGVNARGLTQLRSRNVAAVSVTARLPGFARGGSTIDVSVSALGDASSLLGGTLLATPLYAADGNIYSVAQGPIAIGGFSAGRGADEGGSGSNITKGVPTSGFVANGGIVEREIAFAMNDLRQVTLALRNPDVTTAKNVANAINRQIGPGASRAVDPGTVSLTVPPSYLGDVAGLVADIERLTVQTDQAARVVIDEATGTIVMGENVRIDTVAVAQGNLVVKIEETPQVSQPNPFAPEGATTEVVPRTDIEVDEDNNQRLTVLETGATLRDLVAGLNSLGVGPRDLITILQTIKSAGALQADIVAK